MWGIVAKATASATGVVKPDGATIAVDPTGTISAIATGIGYGQTWQDVRAARATYTTYTNATGKPILVSIGIGRSGGSAYGAHKIIIDGIEVASGSFYMWGHSEIVVIVPASSTYRIEAYSGGNGTDALMIWTELR
jgi:hypothetical protein